MICVHSANWHSLCLHPSCREPVCLRSASLPPSVGPSSSILPPFHHPSAPLPRFCLHPSSPQPQCHHICLSTSILPAGLLSHSSERLADCCVVTSSLGTLRIAIARCVVDSVCVQGHDTNRDDGNGWRLISGCCLLAAPFLPTICLSASIPPPSYQLSVSLLSIWTVPQLPQACC